VTDQGMDLEARFREQVFHRHRLEMGAAVMGDDK